MDRTLRKRKLGGHPFIHSFNMFLEHLPCAEGCAASWGGTVATNEIDAPILLAVQQENQTVSNRTH